MKSSPKGSPWKASASIPEQQQQQQRSLWKGKSGSSASASGAATGPRHASTPEELTKVCVGAGGWKGGGGVGRGGRRGSHRRKWGRGVVYIVVRASQDRHQGGGKGGGEEKAEAGREREGATEGVGMVVIVTGMMSTMVDCSDDED